MGRIALVAALSLGLIAPAAAEDLYFTVINNSALDVDYFYASPSNRSDWGDDLLGPDNKLHAYTQGNATIADGSDQCVYDFKYQMEDGNVYYEEKIDICSLGSYTIYD